MSGICPVVPQRVTNSYDDTPPARDQVDLPIPDPAFNTCDGGTNTETIIAPRPDGETIVIEKCCTVPGPPGPAGPCSLGFEWLGQWVLAEAYVAQVIDFECNGSVVTHNGNSYVCILDHIADSNTEPGIGVDWTTYWDVWGSATGIIWRGFWQVAVDYNENDFITDNKFSYMCTTSHTSDDTNRPDSTFDFEGGPNWILVAGGSSISEEAQGLLDELFDGVIPWLKDIPNWGLEDWLLGLAIGGGIIWAGSELLDMYNQEPEDPANPADSNYTGDLLYSGAFTAPSLPVTVTSLCDQIGFTNIDVSLLPATTLVNMTLGGVTSARSTLQQLANTYFFNMVDSEGILKFIPRKDAPLVPNTLEVVKDFGWTSSNTIPAPHVTKRLQGTDLPKSVEVTHMLYDNGNNEFVSLSNFQTFPNGQDIKVQIPITLTEDQGQDVAESMLVNAHIERNTISFTTNFKYLYLDPGDIINVDTLGKLRIVKIQETQDEGLLSITCTNVDDNSYTSSGIAPPSVTYPDQTYVVGYSAGLALELPPLNPEDFEPRLTLAPHGFGKPDWNGCSIYYSLDGITYILYKTVSQSATWGKCNTILPTGNYYTWDDTSTLEVELKVGTLESRPALDVYNRLNWASVGSEIIGFKNATLTGPNTYILSGFLRGRRGSEVNIGSHISDEGFILLDDSLVDFSYPIDRKEQGLFFKYVSIGSSIDKAVAYQVGMNTVSVRPWSPSHLIANKTGNDWNISWIGRNHINSSMVDSSTVLNPLKFGGYTAIILNTDGSNKRVLTQQINNFIYTETQQIEDFGSVQTNIKIRVAQISLVVGPGYNSTLDTSTGLITHD